MRRITKTDGFFGCYNIQKRKKDLLMKYCRQCGFQLNDEDRFCPKCGKNSDPITETQGAMPAMPQPSPLVNAAFAYSDLPKPNANEALLVVLCNATNPKGNVAVFSKSSEKVLVRNRERGVMRMPVGNVNINYRADRGPGLTVVASRKTTYAKLLTFHPGEIIVMTVNIGRQMTHTKYQSSLGFVIN